jgi:hypothetical protein
VSPRKRTKEDEAKKEGGDGGAGGFPAVENVFLIFGGPTVDMSNNQRKQERHEVHAAEKAPPSFLDWSEDAITFSREDHPNRHYVKTSNRSHNICNGPLTPVTSTNICNGCCLALVTYNRARTTPGLASTTPVTNLDF